METKRFVVPLVRYIILIVIFVSSGITHGQDHANAKKEGLKPTEEIMQLAEKQGIQDYFWLTEEAKNYGIPFATTFEAYGIKRVTILGGKAITEIALNEPKYVQTSVGDRLLANKTEVIRKNEKQAEDFLLSSIRSDQNLSEKLRSHVLNTAKQAFINPNWHRSTVTYGMDGFLMIGDLKNRPAIFGKELRKKFSVFWKWQVGDKQQAGTAFPVAQIPAFLANDPNKVVLCLAYERLPIIPQELRGTPSYTESSPDNFLAVGMKWKAALKNEVGAIFVSDEPILVRVLIEKERVEFFPISVVMLADEFLKKKQDTAKDSSANEPMDADK